MDDVAPIREHGGIRAGIAVLVGRDGHHDRAGVVGVAVVDNGMSAVVDDVELDAGEVGAALRGLTGLGIELLDRHAATDGSVCCVKGVGFPVLGDVGGDVRSGLVIGAVGEVAGGCLLTDDIAAVRQIVRLGVAAGVGRDGRDLVTARDLLVTIQDGVRAVVDDGEGDAGEVGVALRRLSGHVIDLLDRNAAGLHGLRHLRRVVGNSGLRPILINLLEAHKIGVQVVTSRSLGLTDDDGSTRKRRLIVTV